MRNAVVLLSGGLDSATTLAVAKDAGYAPYALSVAYGQRHDAELAAAARVARALGAERHLVVRVDLATFGGSALTGAIDVPKQRTHIGADEIPVTYVPARNTVLLSLALAWAEVLDAFDIFIGVTAVDYSGYPDCRPEFVDAFEALANVATKAAVEKPDRVRIHAPLIDLSKAEIIARGTALGVDYGLTHSCYDPLPDGGPCGACDACALRLEGFRAAGLADPLEYPAAG